MERINFEIEKKKKKKLKILGIQKNKTITSLLNESIDLLFTVDSFLSKEANSMNVSLKDILIDIFNDRKNFE